jgi:hypothetical protein
LVADLVAVLVAVLVAFVALVAFALLAEVRETTLRAAAPARLTKDLLVADAMSVGAPIG